MLLEVYDKNTLERIDIIRTFTFVQYTRYFNDVGSFNLKVPVNEPSLPNILKPNNYILFDVDVMGIIKYFHRESIQTPTVEIKGFLLNHILTYRSILLTTKWNAKVFEIERQMVYDNFINPSNIKRKIDYIRLSETFPESETTFIQDTGDTVFDELRYLNLTRDYGCELVPIISKYNKELGILTNIEAFEFRCHTSTDRTMYNKVGNNPVVFSNSLNNLSDLIYEQDETEYCSMAIVAGEDVGINRKVEEVGNTDLTGIDRIELYVDARDIQSENEDGTEMSESDYRKLLKRRGEEKLEDHEKYIDFEGTPIMTSNNLFTSDNNFLGDFVTVVDDVLNIAADLQVVGYTKSLTEKGEIVDLQFGKQKLTLYKRVRKQERNII